MMWPASLRGRDNAGSQQLPNYPQEFGGGPLREKATRFSLPRFFSQCSPGPCCSAIISPRRRSARRRQSILTQSVPAPSVPPIECSHRTKEREVAKDPTSEGDQRP